MGKRERKSANRARDLAGLRGVRPPDLPALGTTMAVAPPLVIGPAALPTSERYVLGESVTHRCVELIADAIAGAEWGEWKGDDPLPESRLVRRPAERYTRRSWSWRVAATMALYSWCPLLRRGGLDSEGVIKSLVPVMPADVIREPTGDWLYRGENVGPYGVRIIWRTVWPSLDADVAGVLTLAREMFAAAMAAGAAEAAFWEAGGAPRTVLTYEGKLVQAQLDELRANYVRQRQENPGQPAILAGGLKLESFGSDLASSGAGDAAARVGAAVARYFGIPPHLANVPNYASTLTYINTETAGIDFVRYTLSAYAGAIGDALSEELPGDYLAGRQVRLDLGHLMRAEEESRARTNRMALGQWMTREEIRKREGLPPEPILGKFEETPELSADTGQSDFTKPQLVEGAA